MKAILCDAPGGPEALRLVEVPTPVPGAGQVLVRVAYAALNPLDVLIRQGRATWMAGGWPWTPGLEYSGRVEAVGEGVDRSWVGRDVVSFSEFGGCAEFALAPAARIVALDPALGWTVGTAWRTPTLAAWHLLTAAARVREGETVLIHSGAGPVGIMVTQVARHLGATAIGLAGGPAKIAFARPYGAAALFDYLQPDWPDQVRRQTADTGVDVIIDGNGGPRSRQNYAVTAPNSRIFHIGASSGLPPEPASSALLIARSLSVGGFNLNSIPEALARASERELAARLATGTWKFPIGEVVPLAQTASLHARYEARALCGRALLEVGGKL